MVDAHDPSAEETARARKRIVTQGLLAGALIVALLATLVFFERNQTPEPAPTAKTVTRIGPSVSSGREEAPAEASSPLPSLAKAAEEALRQSSEAAAAESAKFSETLPEESADPTIPRDSAGETRPVAKAGATAAQRPTAAPTPAPAAAAPPARGPARSATATASAPVVSTPAGFMVQVGVFSNYKNAEELRARLSLANIPARTETHVQVGPFKTREEAAAAQKKLRELGLEGGILLSAKR